MKTTCTFCHKERDMLPETRCPCGARLGWWMRLGHRRYVWEKSGEKKG